MSMKPKGLMGHELTPPRVKPTPRDNHPYKSLTVNGAKLAYREAGPADGEPILLTHGHISDLRSFIPLQEILASHGYHVYTYSRRFAWPNTPITPSETDDWTAHSRDMIAFIEALNLGRKISLVGNSSGATISLLTAHARPDLVASLTIEESILTTIFFPGGIPPSIFGILRFLFFYPLAFFPVMYHFIFIVSRVITVLNEKDDPAEGVNLFIYSLLGSVYYGELTKERHTWTVDNTDWTAQFFRQGAVMPKFTEEEAIETGRKVPTLCLIGSDTGDLGARESTRRLGKIMPGAKTVWIDGASHLVHEPRPQQVAQAVMAHVERSTKKRT